MQHPLRGQHSRNTSDRVLTYQRDLVAMGRKRSLSLAAIRPRIKDDACIKHEGNGGYHASRAGQ